jgi:hypothetical protein
MKLGALLKMGSLLLREGLIKGDKNEGFGEKVAQEVSRTFLL